MGKHISGIPKRKRRYGWVPDRPDKRDIKYDLIRPAITLPSKIDLKSKMPPILDQGDLGSCTAHAISTALNYERIKNNENGSN